jgi:spore cortex biosynthesis protein YabQ
MVLSNSQQAAVFLWSLLFGVGLGAYFDVFRVFRLFVRCSAVTVLFQDLFCFLTAALASFLFIFEVNDGTVRLFILGAFLVGAVAFRISVGQLLTHLCKKIKIFFRQRRPLPVQHTQTQETENIEG